MSIAWLAQPEQGFPSESLLGVIGRDLQDLRRLACRLLLFFIGRRFWES